MVVVFKKLFKLEEGLPGDISRTALPAPPARTKRSITVARQNVNRMDFLLIMYIDFMNLLRKKKPEVNFTWIAKSGIVSMGDQK